MLISLPHIVSYFIIIVTAFFVGNYFLAPLCFSTLQKRRIGRFFIALIVAMLTYLMAGNWNLWFIIPVVFAGNIVFDFFPAATAQAWLRREGLRLLTCAAVAFLYSVLANVTVPQLLLKVIMLIGGGLGAVFYVGEFIGLATSELAAKNELSWQGLKSGGLWIGRLERFLIFVFILMNNPAGVGFLIAAKSILRFSESRADQRIAEYVLVGTLLSFALAIVISWGTQRGILYLSTIR